MNAVRLVRPFCLLVLGICVALAVTGVAAGAGDAAADGATCAAGHSVSGTAALSPSTRALIASLTIFVLAMLEGFDVITKVPPTLHTPLMSGSNAISGITVVGALIAAGAQQTGLATVLGTAAVAFAMLNVVGGFLVTHRMLKMFKKK